MKLTFARVSALLCSGFGFGFGPAAMARDAGVGSPTAIATKAEVSYCFARVRGLDPERLPPAYLALHLRVAISYRNAAARPVILPLQHVRTVYTGFKPGQLTVFKENPGLLDPVFKAMKQLPPDVSAESPVLPKNDVFTVIPPESEMSPPLLEEIILPVNAKGLFKRTPDLRGHKFYVKFQFKHRELAPAFDAFLSDRWARFGVPWTGTLTTNAILIDVPAAPPAETACQDIYTPAHPVVGLDDTK